MPAFIITFFGGFAAVLVSNSLQDVLDSFKGGLGGIYKTVDEAKKAVRVTSSMYNNFIGFGFIGMMIGIMVMFINVEDPDRFGPGMAIALISFFYAVFIALVVLAFSTAARRQLIWYGEDEKPRLFMSPGASGLFALAIVLMAFAVLMGAFQASQNI